MVRLDECDVFYARHEFDDPSARRGWLRPPIALNGVWPDAVSLKSLKFPRFPSQSFNCARLSKPYDVLWPHWCRLGVLSIPARAVRFQDKITKPRKKNEPPESWTLRIDIEHVPEDDNYSHCELVVFRDDVRREDVPDAAKTAWRQRAHGEIHLLRFNDPSERFSTLRRRVGL